MVHHRFRLARLVTGLAIASAALVGGAGPVAADAENGHSGLVGVHSLNDSPGLRGARCSYRTGDGREGAFAVRMRPPNVFARNRTSSVDSQVVGWSIQVQQSENFVDWYSITESPITTATATDGTKAAFSGKTVKVPFNMYVRVRAIMRWYKPNSPMVQEGTAIHRVQYYVRYLDGSFEDNVNNVCPADLTP